MQMGNKVGTTSSRKTQSHSLLVYLLTLFCIICPNIRCLFYRASMKMVMCFIRNLWQEKILEVTWNCQCKYQITRIYSISYYPGFESTVKENHSHQHLTQSLKQQIDQPCTQPLTHILTSVCTHCFPYPTSYQLLI